MNKSMIDGKYTYFAFIAYTHKDLKETKDYADYQEAKGLQKRLQKYGLPSKLAKENNCKKHIVPVFLDTDDLLSGDYIKEDVKALEDSKFLIVVCSKNLNAHDSTVNEEIINFLDSGHSVDQVIPYIIDYDEKPEKNCFPSELVRLNHERGVNLIGVDIHTPDGCVDRHAALLKIVSKIHNIKRAVLWDEDKKMENRRRILVLIIVMLLGLALGGGIGIGTGAIIALSDMYHPYRVQLQSRLEDDFEWSEVVEATDIGDIVEMQLVCINEKGFFGTLANHFAEVNGFDFYIPDLMVRFVLPDNLQYIEGSTVLYNSNHPNGVEIIEDTAVTSGVNIGSYKINGNAYIRIRCRIVNKTLAIERYNQLVTWASVTVNSAGEDNEPVSKDDTSVLIYYK